LCAETVYRAVPLIYCPGIGDKSGGAAPLKPPDHFKKAAPGTGMRFHTAPPGCHLAHHAGALPFIPEWSEPGKSSCVCLWIGITWYWLCCWTWPVSFSGMCALATYFSSPLWIWS